MELTYSDKNGIELGRILDFDMDTAIGKDENSFSVIIPLENHCCEAGYRIYIDNTEMGGVIDTIIPDTEDNTVSYEGRTWHGIIEKKIIEPDTGEDYYTASGEAHEVLTELIEKIGLSDLYTVSTELSTVEIGGYQFARYESGFSGISKMLYENDGKLIVEYSNKMCHLSVVPLYDYSESEEFDSSQIDFSIERNYRPTNHLICLGKGDLRNRQVIHLFTDENGGIQPYSNVSVPIIDSHYILDKANQVLFGLEEVCEVLDYSNANATDNYVLLTVKPTNWSKYWLSDSFKAYYYLNDDNDFKQNELDYSETYVLQTVQPSDWTTKYATYYTYSSGSYSSVNGTESESYFAMPAKPSDWSKNYADYYYYYFDGISYSYVKVQGVSKTKYNAQTGKPSDWDTNYSAYFSRTPVKKYKYEVRTKTGTKWVKTYEYHTTKIDNVKTSSLVKTYLKRVTTSYTYNAVALDSKGNIPTWKAKKYYTSESYTIAPKWQNGYYYLRKVTDVAPTWTTSTYYTKTERANIPVFKQGTYYTKFTDNYANLVEKGIETLKKSYDCDTINISLDTDTEYDLNDIVGAREQITGISIFQPIIKKIYKIKNGIEKISYEIGAW